MDYYSSSSYKLGIVKGLSLAKKGYPEAQATSIDMDPAYIDGVHEGYRQFFNKAYGDAVKSLRKALRRNSKIEDALYRLHEASIYRKLHIYDATDFTLRKETDWKYSVDKDGKHVYTLTKDKNGKWHCSCTGYNFRHTCKHVDALNQLLNQNTQRLPQHLARVRQLENSLKIWKERLNDPKYAKQAQKQVALREQALQEAKALADKIEAMPKPTRHPREEFEPVIPLLDKLFEGLAPYEIVGSYARGKSTYKDVDILTVMDKSQWNTLKDRLQEDANFGPAPGHTHPDIGDDIIRGGYKNGDRVEYLDINNVKDLENYGAYLLFRIGSAQFNIACRGWLKKFGCGLNEHGIKLPDGSYYKLPTEQAFFDWIGIPFIKREDREDAREFYRLVRNIEEPVCLKNLK